MEEALSSSIQAWLKPIAILKWVSGHVSLVYKCAAFQFIHMTVVIIICCRARVAKTENNFEVSFSENINLHRVYVVYLMIIFRSHGLLSKWH